MKLDFIKNTSGPRRILLYTLPLSSLILLVCLVSLLFVQFLRGTSPNSPATESGESDPSGSSTDLVYTALPVLSGDVYTKGTLLIVNTETKIQAFPSDDDLVTIYGENKTDSYKVNLASFRLTRDALTAFNSMVDAYFLETGDDSITITSAYRTEADQAALSTSSVLPGYSDHHLALSLAIKSRANSVTSALPSDHWIYRNGYKYGFVQRYPEGKEAFTLDTQDYFNCIRYVGVPHAYYMQENDLCLEEYVALLRSYTYDGAHLSVTVNGTVYESYFVPATNPADASAVTQLPVPENAEYTYSGNNTDGFIVTITKPTA